MYTFTKRVFFPEFKSEIRTSKNFACFFLFIYFFCFVKISPCYPDTKWININSLSNKQSNVLLFCVIVNMNIKKHLKQLDDMFA